MFIGHFAVALAAKKINPKASLGTMFISVQLLDLLWPFFLILGIEHVRIVPGITAMTPLDFYDYPISHSLLTAFGWSFLFGIIYFFARRDSKSAWIVGLGVLSHWILDAIVHRPDLPLMPGGKMMVGLGLWNSIMIASMIELGLYVAGIIIYVKTTRASDRIGKYGLWTFVIVLAALWLVSIFGPPPPNLIFTHKYGIAG